MPSSTLNLSDLDGSNGFVVTNQNNRDYDSSSLTISSAGDINGDGFTDLFVRLDNTYIPDEYKDDFFSSYFSIRATSAYVVFGGPNTGTSGSIDLSSLDGNNGFRLKGTFNSYVFDFQRNLSVITGSDINGDGIADLIIDAPGTDPNSTSDPASTYVLFGSADIGAGGSIDRSTLDGTNGFAFNGTAKRGYFSNSATTVSDINGDGIADLIIRNPYARPNGISGAGSIYVVFGGTDIGAGGSIDPSTLDGSNGFAINGTNQNDRLGSSVTVASDINGDGIADLIIHKPDASRNGILETGSTYVVFGGTNIGVDGSIDPSTLNGSNGFVINGTTQRNDFSNSVTTASDINNDGIADLIIGLPGASPNGILNAGSIYVVFGGTNIGADGSIDPSTLNGSNGFAINGTIRQSGLGSSVTSASDINNDGIADLIIALPSASPNGIGGAGSLYVVFGGTNIGADGSIGLSTLDGSNGFVINGTNQSDRLGSSFTTASDINNDGIADLIIAAPDADPNSIRGAGSLYVVFGGTNMGAGGSIDSSTLDGSNGFVINGTTQSDRLGSSFTTASDINNDGIADLIIGVPNADPNDINNAGSTYVVFGGTNIGEDGTLNLSTLDGNNGFVINGFVVGERSGNSIQGLGDINGDGIDDVIIGNAFYNDAPYGDPRNISASSYVVFGSPTSVANPTAGNDTLIGTNAGDFIRGLGGDDLINGRNGDDILRGNWGNDTLIGGNGNDALFGGLGDDLLTGGAGGDLFLLAANFGSETITDFEIGIDTLFLLGGLTFEQLSITQFNDDTLIGISETDKLFATLTGVSANLITAADFVT